MTKLVPLCCLKATCCDIFNGAGGDRICTTEVTAFKITKNDSYKSNFYFEIYFPFE